MRRLAWIGTLLWVGGLLMVPSASATRTAISIPRSIVGPDSTFGEDAVAGGNLVKWANGTLKLLSPTGRVRMLPLTGGATQEGSPLLLGSATRIAALRFSGGHLFAGASGGPVRQVESCADAPSLDGDYVAYLRVMCGVRSPLAVVVRDPTASASAATFPLPAAPVINGSRVPQYVSIAGDYIAYSDGANVTVRDWRTGAIAYSQPPEVSQGCEDASQFNPIASSRALGFCGLAVERDGSLWELVGSFTFDPGGALTDTCAGHINHFTAGATTAETVALGAACEGRLFAANGSVVFTSSSNGSVLDNPSSRQTFLRPGSPARALGRPGALYSFDGTTLIAEHSTCTSAAVVAVAVASDPPLRADPDFNGRPCRGEASGLHVSLGTHPTLRARITCPHGCVGPLVIGSTAHGPNGLFKREAASRNFALQPGRSLTLRIKLEPNGTLVSMARHTVASGRTRMYVPVWFLELIDNPRTPLHDATAWPARRVLATIG